MNLALTGKHRVVKSQQFALWAGIVGICMMFVALTSAYLVRRGAGNWLDFALPAYFYYSTLAIVASSVTLELAKRSQLKSDAGGYRLWLVVSGILGLAFCVMQYWGWIQLYEVGVHLSGNPAGSFIYAISGLHVAHVIGGLGALAATIINAFALKFTVNEIKKTRLQMVLNYWHFVGFLWIYLFVFFLIFR